ncbi:tetratricopeptide repeat protein [Sphingobium sp. AN558]|uniref:O-linked N-acetylglucosamine transferase family protein n=1 Tax=Sphingobium sp. AN558 TaxID=3133442 RepID=UPI0030C34601
MPSSGLEILFSKARQAERRGDPQEARRLLADLLSRYPQNRRAAEGLSRLDPAAGSDMSALQAEVGAIGTLHAQGDYAKMARRAEALIARFPQVSALHGLSGAAYLGLDDAILAEKAFRKALADNPRDAANQSNLGIALRRQGRLADAERCYAAAIAIQPDHAEAHYNLANLLGLQDRYDEAIASYRAALAFKPDYVDALYNLGNIHRERKAFAEAVDLYARTLAIRPDHYDALNNLGYARLELGDRDAAIAVFRQATAIESDTAKAHVNLANALTLGGALDEAHVAFDRAIQLAPDDTHLRAQLLYLEAHLCDWSGRDSFAALPVHAVRGSDPIPPFIALPFEDDPARQLARSRIVAHAAQPGRVLPLPRPEPGEKIRIGYFSADFHDHATLHLLSGLLRAHDRDRFAIHAFSLGADDGEGARDAIRPHLDAFHDIRFLTDDQAIDLARRHALDIAIDLKGHTRDARPALFAGRMAPVQIGYLGYPGSIGGDFLDYIIADPVVIPSGQEVYYSEQVIRLPGSYQPNDDRRVIGQCAEDRTSLGLPAEGFVFCSFNQNWKISPREFSIWMRLLARVEGSVLWLIRSNPWAETNLRREAQARGIDPARLVFAEKRSHADHLARHRHADLFLDSFIVNAHTTASDALWAGLPVLTMPGRQFAARVGASLLTAIDLPDLIAGSEADYEAKALELAQSPGKLAALKSRLAVNRQSSALFDTATYARHIEAAYVAAHQRRLDGLEPAAIWID